MKKVIIIPAFLLFIHFTVTAQLVFQKTFGMTMH